ncbi:MAG: hypothetical protein HQK63_11035 [Desulfamplus sp.]|nr:hypothetical protein [Desulfamplus sp.]
MDSKEEELKGLTLDQKTIEILVANIIPTSKYFESRFDNLQYQVNEIKDDIKNLESRMEKRFEQVDQRFADMKTEMDKSFGQVDQRFADMKTEMDKSFGQVDQRFADMKTEMDKRFGQVDQRFEKMDRRFQQVEDKLDKIIERIDRRIDDGLRENRAQSMRMFTFAMTFSAISMLGLIGKMLKLF